MPPKGKTPPAAPAAAGATNQGSPAPVGDGALAAALEQAGMVDIHSLGDDLDALTGGIPAEETVPAPGQQAAEQGKPSEDDPSSLIDQDPLDGDGDDDDADDMEDPTGADMGDDPQDLIDKAVGKRVAELKKARSELKQLRDELAALKGEAAKPASINDTGFDHVNDPAEFDRLDAELQANIDWALDNADGTEDSDPEKIRNGLRYWTRQQRLLNAARASLVGRQQSVEAAKSQYPLMFQEGHKWNQARQDLLAEHPELRRSGQGDLFACEILYGRYLRSKAKPRSEASAREPEAVEPAQQRKGGTVPPSRESHQQPPQTYDRFEDALDAATA